MLYSCPIDFPSLPDIRQDQSGLTGFLDTKTWKVFRQD
jgi:hypothetical protein